jgi:preprotein translocase subunit SecG
MTNFFLYLCIGLFIFICLVLILVILIQKGRGGGLSSAFGGAGGNTAFGSKTGDVLTWVTSVVFGVFLLLAVALNLLADYKSRHIAQAPAPAASSAAPIQVAPTTAPAQPEAATPATQPAK